MDNITKNGKIKREKTSICVDATKDEFHFRTKEEEKPYEQNFYNCTTCRSNLVTFIKANKEVPTHPVLGVPFCKSCCSFYTSGEFSSDEDEDEKYCRWCGQGGSLIVCSKCTCAFCQGCIKYNFGKPQLTKVLKNKNWLCYICDSKPLWQKRKFVSRLQYYFDHFQKLKKRIPEEFTYMKTRVKPTEIFQKKDFCEILPNAPITINCPNNSTTMPANKRNGSKPQKRAASSGLLSPSKKQKIMSVTDGRETCSKSAQMPLIHTPEAANPVPHLEKVSLCPWKYKELPANPLNKSSNKKETISAVNVIPSDNSEFGEGFTKSNNANTSKNSFFSPMVAIEKNDFGQNTSIHSVLQKEQTVKSNSFKACEDCSDNLKNSGIQTKYSTQYIKKSQKSILSSALYGPVQKGMEQLITSNMQETKPVKGCECSKLAANDTSSSLQYSTTLLGNDTVEGEATENRQQIKTDSNQKDTDCRPTSECDKNSVERLLEVKTIFGILKLTSEIASQSVKNKISMLKVNGTFGESINTKLASWIGILTQGAETLQIVLEEFYQGQGEQKE